jgi:hypothetical protein
MMTGFERYTKKTRRAIFLEEMEQVVPWAKLCALIEPHYPKPGNGRRPKDKVRESRRVRGQGLGFLGELSLVQKIGDGCGHRPMPILAIRHNRDAIAYRV